MPASNKQKSGPYSVQTFHNEIEKTLIVYGTGDETDAHREAGVELQRALDQAQHQRDRADQERPRSNGSGSQNASFAVDRPTRYQSHRCQFTAALPITFGSRSFVVNTEVYAHTDSGVMIAAANPVDKRFSIVVIAGLDSSATRRVGAMVADGGHKGEVVILPHGGPARSLVIVPKADVTVRVTAGRLARECVEQGGARKGRKEVGFYV